MSATLPPFRAIIVAHNWRGGTNLCIGARGYNKDSFVVLYCTDEERRQFPVGTEFELVCVEETRGSACADCGGSGWTPLKVEVSAAGLDTIDGHPCNACGGKGRAPGNAPPMKGELPSVTIEGGKRLALYAEIDDDPGNDSSDINTLLATEEHLAALLAALPDEQLERLLRRRQERKLHQEREFLLLALGTGGS